MAGKKAFTFLLAENCETAMISFCTELHCTHTVGAIKKQCSENAAAQLATTAAADFFWTAASELLLSLSSFVFPLFFFIIKFPDR